MQYIIFSSEAEHEKIKLRTILSGVITTLKCAVAAVQGVEEIIKRCSYAGKHDHAKQKKRTTHPGVGHQSDIM